MPVRVAAVVDRMVRSQGLGAGQFVIAAGGDDHLGAEQFGELQREQ